MHENPKKFLGLIRIRTRQPRELALVPNLFLKDVFGEHVMVQYITTPEL